MKIKIIDESKNSFDKKAFCCSEKFYKKYVRNSGGKGPMMYHSLIKGIWSRIFKGKSEKNKFEFLMFYSKKDEKQEKFKNEIKRLIQKQYTKDIKFESLYITEIKLITECGRRYK